MRPGLEADAVKDISPLQKFLIALSYFCHGWYQRAVGTHFLHPCSQPTVSRVLDEVIEGLLKLVQEFIVFPKSADRRRIISSK